MRAWLVAKKGFTNLQLVSNYPVPSIKSDYDVLIKNIAVGINPVDYNRCIRSHPLFSSPPFITGADGCGLIQEVGSKVDPSTIKPGTLVYYGANLYENGCFSDYTVQDARGISVVPEKAQQGKSVQEVATIFASLPVAAFTAYTNICIKLGLPIVPVGKRVHPKFYKNILVTGGSGGVGGFCLQLLTLWRQTLPKELEKEVRILTLCSEKNHAYAESLGATHTIDYNIENLTEKILEVTDQEGVDAFIDNTGIKTIHWAVNVLNNGGDYVTNLPVPNDFDMSQLFFRSQNIHQTYLAYMHLKKLPYQLKEIRDIGDIIAELLIEGKIKSTVSEVIEFSQIKEQLTKSVRCHTKGKVVALL